MHKLPQNIFKTRYLLILDKKKLLFNNILTTISASHRYLYEEVIMSLMSTEQVAEFLGVKEERVKRLARESLLIVKAEDENGEPQFDSNEVAKYKELAARFGGL